MAAVEMTWGCRCGLTAEELFSQGAAAAVLKDMEAGWTHATLRC
jgi:hypothetical protein